MTEERDADGCTKADRDLIEYIRKQPDSKGGSKGNGNKYRENYDRIKWGVYEKNKQSIHMCFNFAIF